MINFKKKIKAIIAKILRKNENLVHGILVTQKIITFPGTIRITPDQDDAWYFHLSGKYKRIFDIGANMGYTALLANIQSYTEKLLLVDPNPKALAIAAKNLIYNNLATNCTFITSFVSDQTGKEIPFYTIGTGAAGSMFMSHAESAAAINSYFMVTTTTIDKLVTQVGWYPDFVKIDVEGAESLVLNGAVELAKLQSTAIMVEMHSPKELPMINNAEKILDWCNKTNYKAWYMKEGIQLKSPEQIAHRGKCHLLLLPFNWPYPDELKKIKQGAKLPDQIL